MSAIVPIDLESQLALGRDSPDVCKEVRGRAGVIACDASDRGVYWLVLHPRRDPAEDYVVRIHWETYPHAPPSVKFATAIGGRLEVTSAWPLISGYRPSSFDICQPFTREGFALHPEWQTTTERWPVTGNVFLWVAQILQRDLDTRYEGRSG